MTDTVIIDATGLVRIIEETATVVQIVAAGPQGAAGPNSIGGYGFDIISLIAGDVLGFNGTLWYNRAIPNITVSASAPSAPATNDVWIDTS